METRNYVSLIGIHALLGVLVYLIPFISKVYALLIPVVGFLWIVRNKNRNHEVLYVCAYLVGVEVFLRMTKGSPNYEYVKYLVTGFYLLGMYLSGISKNVIAYWLFLLLLLPGVFIGMQVLDYETDMRKAIMFNISGSLCLAMASIYCYLKKVSLKEINNILFVVGLPIVSQAVYLTLYTPDLRDAITGTASNFETSGGFGPNQVATALGLGMFIFFSRVIYLSKTTLVFWINLSITLLITYRGLVTFSRGGMITGVVMIVFLLVVSFFRINSRGKLKLGKVMILIGLGLVSIWVYTEVVTGGMIGKRYANEDALGREKESLLSGREQISMTELQLFVENPLWGGGAGKGREYRIETTGRSVASHSEVTRMAGEHGFLGIIGLLVLMITPMVLYLNNRENVFIISFLIFWFLTINHAAMRTAAPAFIYALSLLKVTLYDKKDTLHWKQIISTRKKPNGN